MIAPSIGLLAVILVFAPTFAQASSKADQSVLQAEAKTSFVAYKDCMENAAGLYAKSDASPLEIADAAQSKCGGTFYSYQQAVESYFLSIGSRSGSANAINRAKVHTEDTKNKLRDRVVQLVVESRINP